MAMNRQQNMLHTIWCTVDELKEAYNTAEEYEDGTLQDAIVNAQTSLSTLIYFWLESLKHDDLMNIMKNIER